MAASSLKCPECSVVLKLSAPVAAGKKIRCPKCQAAFLPEPRIQAAPPRKTSPSKTADSEPDLVESFEDDEAKTTRPRRKTASADPDYRPRRKSANDAPLNKTRLIVLLGVLGVVAIAGGTMLVIHLSKDEKQVAQAPDNLNGPFGHGGPRVDSPPKDPFRPPFDPRDQPQTEKPPIDTPPEDRPPIKPPVDRKPIDKPPVKPIPPRPKDPEPIDDPGSTGPPPPLPGAKDRPFLTLDSGGHTAMARTVLFTPDGKRVISVAADKTVRVWDVQTGETTRMFHVPVGPADEGSLYAAAITRDGRKLAVGGIPLGFAETGGLIYLIDMSTGRAERTFKGHAGGITGLAFSTDGKWLASCSGDGTAIVYSVVTGQVFRHLQGHKDTVNGLAYSPDGRYLATASRDKTARIWNLQTGKTIAELVGHTDKVICVAFTADSKTVLTGSVDATVRIWGLDGKLRQTLPVRDPRPIQVTSLSVTRDGKEALYTGVSAEGHAGIIDLTKGDRRIEFKLHTNSASSGQLSPDGKLAVTHGGDSNETYIWKTADGAVVHKLAGKGQGLWAAGWTEDGKSICWGTANRGEGSPVEHTFRLDTFDYGPAPRTYLGAARNVKEWSLERLDFFRIAIKNNGRVLHTFQSPTKGDRIYSYTITGGERAIMGGSFGLYLVDLKTNRIIRNYLGHSGSVTAVSPSPSRRYFLTGGSDQILNVFHHDRDEPLLSLFFAGREWIVWTPEGYYASSANGERLMGWLINIAPDKLASYFPAVRFRASLFQPDAIRRTLRAGSVQRALELVAKEKNKPAQATDLASVLPPEVTITSPGEGEINQAKLEVKAKAKSTGNHAVTSMRLLVDGRPWQGVKGVKAFDPPRPGEVEATWEVQLDPGRHQLTVLADSSVSRGLSTPLEVTRSGADGDLPNLYVLAMGVSAYPGKMKLHYAASDADLIAKTFKERTTGVFKSVQVKTITDQQATKKGIVEGLVWLAGVMTARDVAIVSFSGHGTRDPDGNFYLVPVDVNIRDPRSLVSGQLFKDALANLPGKVVCLLDACHSGSVADGEGIKEGQADDLVRDLVNDEYGVIVMCSSLGSEYSLESSETKAGFFTLSIVEGLAGKADFNGDSVVYIHELDFYAAQRVKQLSRGEQNPTTGKPPGIRSFPLSRN